MILVRVLLVPFIVVLVVFGTQIYCFTTNLKSLGSSELTLIVV